MGYSMLLSGLQSIFQISYILEECMTRVERGKTIRDIEKKESGVETRLIRTENYLLGDYT
jgi:hypothetical protein